MKTITFLLIIDKKTQQIHIDNWIKILQKLKTNLVFPDFVIFVKDILVLPKNIEKSFSSLAKVIYSSKDGAYTFTDLIFQAGHIKGNYVKILFAHEFLDVDNVSNLIDEVSNEQYTMLNVHNKTDIRECYECDLDSAFEKQIIRAKIDKLDNDCVLYITEDVRSQIPEKSFEVNFDKALLIPSLLKERKIELLNHNFQITNKTYESKINSKNLTDTEIKTFLEDYTYYLNYLIFMKNKNKKAFKKMKNYLTIPASDFKLIYNRVAHKKNLSHKEKVKILWFYQKKLMKVSNKGKTLLFFKKLGLQLKFIAFKFSD